MRGKRSFLLNPIYLASFFFILGSLFQSCRSAKNTSFFNSFPNDTLVHFVNAPSLHADTIKIGDQLDISVSSMNEVLDRQFQNSGVNESDPSLITQHKSDHVFSVDDQGFIYLHFLGKVSVNGLSLSNLKTNLELALVPYLKDPIVSVRFMNRKITVIGEVKSPKIIPISNGGLSIVDALVSSGDLTEYALIEDIMIIRDSLSYKKIKHLSLNDKSLFTSDWYYLKSNDIVYVKKDMAKAIDLDKKRSIQMTISIIVSLLTLTTVLINNIFR
jgi:polysaccharide export outer membrane protein